MIRCGYCAHEFAEEDGIRSCGKCGKPGGCRMVRCPKCFYENPPEAKAPKTLRKVIDLLKK
ncbi:hypothetical protein GSUET_22510 [Geobacter sulfurreducens subsp. ethanolicus]|uniref:hypothetical protein n=1 Tax=Geobacter sp. 60473 TaxID=3080755 RepID=UPI0025735293|nr:hypothetical protein [Geobacter sulfurreducens]BEH10639.1 hypothetical protein GSUET_22510 [Geobacter sulfurreducens subsp. ethanolicus]BET57760.1 hypothetical protein GEO60473_08000 [Geobacter sp. 60473]HML79503.1 hypothetical protein [Geobacter sulfurreducens]